MRVSAGFFVSGLSGNTRIQILPPRFTKRVMATRLASICRSVIQPGSSTFRPKSPKDSVLPRQALPVMRPRCCLRYFTFFGINITNFPVETLLARSGDVAKLRLYQNPSKRSCGNSRCLALFLRQDFSLINPAFHADDAVSGPRLRKSVVNVGAQRVQGQATLQVPFRTRDFVSIQPSTHPDFDSLASEA